jgi:hydroxymethylglutaryl-CoA lyase
MTRPDIKQDPQIRIVECPRDAMQGWPHAIATRDKIRYLQSLLAIGFDTLDFGSFVSPKAIPQMADTKDVLKALDLSATQTSLLAIIANERGAEEALGFDAIRYLGFPFSLSETFQKRNTNSSLKESLQRVEAIQKLCLSKQKELVIYLSMGFGNPYGDPYSEEILQYWAGEMVGRGIQILSLADTVGLATPQQISFALNTLVPQYPNITIGVHLHATAQDWEPKLLAALEAGCTRFDGALKGIGGCPMAQDALVGNTDTALMIPFLESRGYALGLDHNALQQSLQMANEIFV